MPNATDYTYFSLKTAEFHVLHKGEVRASADKLLVLPGDGDAAVRLRRSCVVGDAWTEDGDRFKCVSTRASTLKDPVDVIADLDDRYGNPVAVNIPDDHGPFYRKDTGAAVREAEAVILLSGHGNYPPLALAYNPR